MFWDSAPTSVALSLVFRLITSLVPLGILLTTRLIINAVVAHVARHEELPKHFWMLVVAAFLMAGLSVVLTRAIDYLDEVLASPLHDVQQLADHEARRGARFGVV